LKRKFNATRKYTFEELYTLLAKIEAFLNSRPLSPISEDPIDLLALTPAHFLVGGTRIKGRIRVYFEPEAALKASLSPIPYSMEG